MKRYAGAALSLLGFFVLTLATLPASAASGAHAGAASTGVWHPPKDPYPVCQSYTSMCVDAYGHVRGGYVGHDEPSIEYKDGRAGTGNDMTYLVRLPKDPATQPNASGSGGATWNFQLRPTFWFGLTLCDSQSAPEFTHKCTPDTDRNNLVGTNPKKANYIGKHPGNAFMELQFYEPGYVPQFEGFGCTKTKYCAAMTIDSFVENQNNGVANTKACDNYILGGVEPINWAYITKSGKSQAPANPLFTGTFTKPNLKAVNINPAKDLLMSPGDWIRIHIHDTRAGLRTDLTDLTTHKSGSMTASVANGFGHILYTPKSKKCQEAPYAFHPEYSSANPRGNTWSAHTYNVAYSDEIGHFENCLNVDVTTGNCTSQGSQDPALDADDAGCVPGTDSLLVKINGCFAPDTDYDGQSYRNDWPGTGAAPSLVPTPVVFTSPVSRGRNYSTIAFETDLPRIEAIDSQLNPPFCDRTTGANCVNPPPGAQFYPMFTTRAAGKSGRSCEWQEGGPSLPRTTNTFGGTSTAEFGPLLKTVFPTAGFKIEKLFDNFNSGNKANPCRVRF